MTMEEPEERRFEDYTNASEWENFTSRLEEAICSWRLHRDERVMSRQNSQQPGARGNERISVGPFDFLVTLHRGSSESKETSHVFEQISSLSNDFPPRAHCIQRWFGVNHFIVIMPFKSDSGMNNAESKLVLSSACVALNNTECSIPIFVKIQQPWRRMFTGVCVIEGKQIWFDTVHLRYSPPQFSHLTGLIEVFKSKLGHALAKVPVIVSVHFTYVLRDFDLFHWPQFPPDFERQDDKGIIAEVSQFPFGSTSDPIMEIHLSTTWPSLTEDVVVDNEVYSDLDPIEAPHWTLRARFTEETRCLMDECLSSFLKLGNYQQGIEEIIGQIPTTASEEDYRSYITGALNRLTQLPIPSAWSGVVHATNMAAFSDAESPFPAGVMDIITKYVFPDADEECTSNLHLMQCEEDFVPHYKTAPIGSLTHRLSVALCLVNLHYGGIRAVAFLWREIVLELRYRWENSYLLPSLANEPPNSHYCLLHQKMQMLNHCIRQKQKQEACHSSQGKSDNIVIAEKEPLKEEDDVKHDDKAVDNKEDDDNDDDAESSGTDEFFEAMENPDQPLLQSEGNQLVDECDTGEEEAKDEKEVEEEGGGGEEEEEEQKQQQQQQQQQPQQQQQQTGEEQKEEGALRQLGNEILIKNGRPLYIPQTQEPLVMTEDMVVELSQKLSELGTSEEAAKQRARMQSAQLLSDMQAFKAANPGCILADFVRWYSPRDWIPADSDHDEINDLIVQSDVDKSAQPENDWDIVDEDTQQGTIEKSSEEPDGQALCVQGRLSVRMEQPGNFWKEMWDDVVPLSVRRQKRLFDDTVEAEKVLQMFASFSVCDLVFHVFPVILHNAVNKLEEQQGVKQVSLVQNNITRSSSLLAKIGQSSVQQQQEFKEIVKQISHTELLVARAQSLLEKLHEGLTSYWKKRGKQDDSPCKEKMEQLVNCLLTEPQTVLRGAARGYGGRAVLGIVEKSSRSRVKPGDKEGDQHEDSKVVFPASVGREFILRVKAPRPSSHLESVPQRMYCVLAPDEFRLAAAFTSHIAFH